MQDIESRLKELGDSMSPHAPSELRPTASALRSIRVGRSLRSGAVLLTVLALTIGGFAGARSLSSDETILPAGPNSSSEPTPSETTVTGDDTAAWTGPCLDSQDGPPPQVCFGPLKEGTYTSQRFEPALTFTVPSGWNNPWDTRDAFELWSPGWSDTYLFDQPGLSVRRDPRPDEGCSPFAEARPSNSALELATWVTNHPGIETEAPSPTEIAGLPGYLLDVSIADTWRESCPGGPAVWLFENLYVSDQPGLTEMRLILLDLPEGGSVLIGIDGKQVDAAMPVVHSFSFGSD